LEATCSTEAAPPLFWMRRFEPAQIAYRARGDGGVQRGGRTALILADDRGDGAGDGNPGVGQQLFETRGRRLLVRGRGEAVDEADADGPDVPAAENLGGGLDVFERQRLDLRTGGVDAAPHGAAQMARHQDGRVRRAMIPRVLADAAADLQAVAESGGGQQTRLGALLL
jgi:hypothetical protein